MPYLKYINDEGLNIARGLVRDTSHINKFGYNENIGTDYETVWSLSSNLTYPSNANTVVLTSSDVNDAAGNTGARIVEVQGIDENYFANTVTVPLNGTGDASNSAIKFWRVHRMIVKEAGSSEKNEGNITATIGTTTSSYIAAGDSQTLQCSFTTAKNQTGYIIDMMVNSGKENKAGIFRLIQRHINNGNVQQTKQVLESYRNNIRVPFPVPLVVPPLHDIQIQGKNLNTGNFSAVANFNIILVEDPDV
jgi:hypothetical protein